MHFIKYILLFIVVCIPYKSYAEHGTEPLKIGVYLPLTGKYAESGQSELDGIRLAHEKMPEVLERPINLVVVDNKSDKLETAKVVSQLVKEDELLAVIGTYNSSLAMAGAEVLEKANIPMVGTSCTNPLVTQNKYYIFRACFVDSYQASAIAAYVYNTLGYKKAAILMDISEYYAVGLAAFFKHIYTSIGGEVSHVIKYTAEDTDFSTQLTELILHKPDIVFIPSYFTQGVAIMQQARALGATFRFIGADAMDNPDIVSIGGAAIEGFLHTTFPYDVNMQQKNEQIKSFNAAWKKMYPNKEPSAIAALSYNAYLMLIDSITRAAKADPMAVAAALASTKNLSTPLGTINVNSSHNVEMPIGIVTYKNGKRTYLGEVETH